MGDLSITLNTVEARMHLIQEEPTFNLEILDLRDKRTKIVIMRFSIGANLDVLKKIPSI